jgi:diguanylate cyclase (GGDEF)-like protein/PAS domain S-box-containing protein
VTDLDYEQLYHHAPCGLVTTSATGVVVSVNATFLTWTGYRAADVVGRNFVSLLDAGSQLFYETRHLQTLHLQGRLNEVALTLRRADGSGMTALVNSVLMPQENPPVVHTAVFDASGRREYESELLRARRSAESSEARVRILQDVSGTFGVSMSDEALAQALTTVAREAFSAVDAAVLLRDEEGVLRLAAGTNPLTDADAPIASLGNASAEIVVHADAAEGEFSALAAELRRARRESVSVTPLRSGTEQLGVLVCFFTRRREFDEQFFDLQRALGRQAAQTLVRVRLQRHVEHLALHDPLTGLANRQLLERNLEAAIADSDRADRPLALVFVDVDGFKSINDRWGHRTGDTVLCEIADRLRSGVRSGDLVARIGGDEFVAVCSDADSEAAATIAERILAATRRAIVIEDGPVSVSVDVSVSVGVATYCAGRDARPTGDQLLIRADTAMYQSKRTGKDRVTIDTAS